MSSVKANQSLARAFAVLEFLADNPGARLKDVAAATDLAAPTALRFLSNLQSLGYLRQEGMCYYIGPRLASLARGVWSIDLSSAIHTALVELANDTGLTAFFVVCERDEAVYMQRGVPGRASLISTQRIGARAPLYCTGVGKIFLAERSDDEIAHYCMMHELVPLTAMTITDERELRVRLQNIRNLGFACDDEECELGVRCLAYPVRDERHKVRAAISISGPAAQVDRRPNDRQLTAMNRSAEIISDILKDQGW